MIGKILDNRYEILDVVGSGGMAIVYKAKCRLLNRYVAIKMLRNELKDDTDFVERFRVEAQSAASLNHQNIVSVYDVGQHEGRDYFVMEFVDGITLKELIKTKNVSWQDACKYTIQICNAIDHAHKKNIVHRDIKPHNIIITPDNIAKVTDFGIARAVTSSTIVRAGNIIGSVHYFSPEQACGGVVDFKSDIYSIGVVLYELLAGKLPFDAESPVAIAKMHVDNLAVRPSEINSEIPQELSDIVLKAMAKQPVMRYQNVADLAKDLTAVTEAPSNVQIHDMDATQFVPIVTPDENGPYTVPKAPDTDGVIVPPSAKSTRRKNGSSVIAWIIAAVLIVAASVAVTYAVNPALFQTNQEPVPNLIGQRYSEVALQYKNADFKIVMAESRYSDEYDEDIIIQQTPSDGNIKKGDVISVVVSSGKHTVTLADYTGNDINAVKAELNKLGITNIVIEYEYHTIHPKDTVFRQSPGNGSSIKRTSGVTLYVSSGQEQVKMPDLYGLSEAEAKRKIEEAGLTVGTISELETTKKEGTVLSQDIPKDTLVDKGTAISFTVSKKIPVSTSDPTPTPTPSSTPKPTPTPAPPVAEE